MKGMGSKEKLDEEFMEAEQLVAHTKALAQADTIQALQEVKFMALNDSCADCGAPSKIINVIVCIIRNRIIIFTRS